jgi:hypothetical protein
LPVFLAKPAGVDPLLWIHYSQSRAARTLAEASAVFAPAELVKEGTTLEVPALR